MEVDKKIKEFCYKYEARCSPTGQAWRRVKRIPYSLYSESDPMMFHSVPYMDIETIRIEMPEDRFRALLEHADWVETAGLKDNRHFQNHVMRVSEIFLEHEQECKIRNENPAVRAAYEKYQMLLELAR